MTVQKYNPLLPEGFDEVISEEQETQLSDAYEYGHKEFMLSAPLEEGQFVQLNASGYAEGVNDENFRAIKDISLTAFPKSHVFGVVQSPNGGYCIAFGYYQAAVKLYFAEIDSNYNLLTPILLHSNLSYYCKIVNIYGKICVLYQNKSDRRIYYKVLNWDSSNWVVNDAVLLPNQSTTAYMVDLYDAFEKWGNLYVMTRNPQVDLCRYYFDGDTLVFDTVQLIKSFSNYEIRLCFHPLQTWRFIAYSRDGYSIGELDSGATQATWTPFTTGWDEFALCFFPDESNRLIFSYTTTVMSTTRKWCCVADVVNDEILNYRNTVRVSGSFMTDIAFVPQKPNMFVLIGNDAGLLSQFIYKVNNDETLSIKSLNRGINATTHTYSVRFFGTIGVINCGLIGTGTYYGRFRAFDFTTNLRPNKVLGKLVTSGAAYQTATVSMLGGVIKGLSGLTHGEIYYLQGDGSLKKESENNGGVLVGFAISSSELKTVKSFHPDLLEKLKGVEENANNYQHPETHSIDMITDSATHVKMTVAERSKLTAQPSTPVTSVNGQTGAVTISVPEPLPDSYGLNEVQFSDYTTQHISTGGRFLIHMDKTNAQLEARRTPDLVDGFNTKYVTLNMPAPNPGLYNQLEFFISCVHDTELLTRANAIRHIQLGNTDFDLGKLKVVDGGLEGNTAAELIDFGEAGFHFGHGAYLHCALRRYPAVGEGEGGTSGVVHADYGRFFYDDVNEVWNFSSGFHKYQLVIFSYYEGIFAS